ncbi:MAG: hypothetical protein K6G26_13975, partial [Lachnospiraceae bacterium]|nr:hypothetical protein [Lachnospiraceae bacterium]
MDFNFNLAKDDLWDISLSKTIILFYSKLKPRVDTNMLVKILGLIFCIPNIITLPFLIIFIGTTISQDAILIISLCVWLIMNVILLVLILKNFNAKNQRVITLFFIRGAKKNYYKNYDFNNSIFNSHFTLSFYDNCINVHSSQIDVTYTYEDWLYGVITDKLFIILPKSHSLELAIPKDTLGNKLDELVLHLQSKGIKTVTSKKLRFFSKYAISEYIPEIKTEETTALEYFDNTKFIAIPENNYKDKFDYSYNKEDCLNFIKRSIKIKPSIAIKFTLFYTVFFFIFLVFITGFISMIIFNGKLPLRREYFLLSNLGLAFISSAVSIINSTKKSIKTAKLNASLHHPDTASIYIYEDSV